jgi:hypothetical protein
MPTKQRQGCSNGSINSTMAAAVEAASKCLKSPATQAFNKQPQGFPLGSVSQRTS